MKDGQTDRLRRTRVLSAADLGTDFEIRANSGQEFFIIFYSSSALYTNVKQ